jgi:lipopolysaccharide biosynthesis regulator YciM
MLALTERQLAELVGVGAALGVILLAMSRHRRRRREAKAILAGVRSMISDDPDAAIEALSDAARLGTPQALDTYLALGALFRRTGDLSRAIRLHRNMLISRQLDPARLGEVELELAQDYRRAGMLAEAAELLVPRATSRREAAEALREVRADQGLWRDAAALQAALPGPGSARLRSHLLAAAARTELAAGRPEAGLAAAEEAVEADEACADARLARAEVLAAGGEAERALDDLVEALLRQPGEALLAGPALERLHDPTLALGRLERLVSARPEDAAPRLLCARLLHRLGRRQEALDEAGEALRLDRTGEVTLALRDLLRRSESPPPREPGELAARHALTMEALRRRAEPLRCGRCGAEAAAREWRCRSCGRFDVFP